MRRTTRTLLALAVVLAFITTFSVFSCAQSSRVTQQIDESKMVSMSGNTRPEAMNPVNDRGPVSDTFDVDHIFLLLQRSPKQEQKLDKLIDQLSDPNSPNFHKWLTPEQYGKYGVSQGDIDKVTTWLESHGFRINQVYTNHMVIDFSGTAGQLRSVFRTDIHQLEVNGEQHIANVNDPMIPAALMPVVEGIVSLNDFRPHPTYKTKADYTFAGCASSASAPTEPGTCYAVTPSDDAVIYNLNPVFSAGYSGQGQTIAIIEDTDSYGTDFATYRSNFGLTSAYPSGNLTTTHPGSCTDPGTNADDGEADLDVEMATTFAPSATINLISCPSGTVTFGGQIALQNMINAGSATPSASVVSVSYGVCEAFNGAGGNKMFYNTYQQAATEGYSVFVSSGDAGASQCSGNFGLEYSLASLGITGWGESPYNVSVGGTDYEDVYNAKTGQNGGAPLSTYWNSSNTGTYGSAKSYIPEIPWNDSCGSALISEFVQGNFQTYSSGHLCNTSPYNTTAGYISLGAASGGASNCATGAAGSNETDYGIITSECQGLAKPSFQTGAALTGGKAVYGSNTDGLRDIPDVSLFAANGVWGHFQTVCWADPAYTSDGSASCAGAPSTWSGFGGTSVATPSMAAIQALINQKTGTNWGNPLAQYYQIGQNQYGTAGGTFLGTSCNSSTGNPGGCAFNDVTQGDIDYACEYNGTLNEAHCYPGNESPTYNSGIYGVESTDNVTSATVLWGGTGYTSAPTCTIAGPTNNNPYLSPTGTTLYAGGTQATCTASVSTATTTAVWTFAPASTSAVGMQVSLTNVPLGGSTTCGPYTLAGSSTKTIASGLCTSIGSSCSLASCTNSSSTDTLTAKTAGAAGNFIVQLQPGTIFQEAYLIITNGTKGQGPNYVSGITITAAGRGYQPDTPITFGGPGTGAVAVANTSPGTAAQSYQPAYGAAPGYDMATGLGTPNAYNFVNNCVWTNNCPVATTTAVSSSLNPSVFGESVNFTATVTGNSPTGTVNFYVDSALFDTETLASGSATSMSTSTLAVGTHTVTATYSGDSGNLTSNGTLSGGQVVSKAGVSGMSVASGNNPSTYGQSVTFTATIPGDYGQVKGNGVKPQTVTGSVTWSANTGCGTTPVTSGNPGTATCTTSILPAGTDTVTGNYSGDANHSAGSASTSQTVNQVSTTTGVTSSLDPSGYGQSVSFTATVTGASPTGTVQFYVDSVLFDTETLASGSATSISTTTLTVGNHTVTATYAGDATNLTSSGSLAGGQTVNISGATVVVGSSLNPSNQGQSVTFTATISGDNGLLKGRKSNFKGKPMDPTGTVTWSANTGCSVSTVTGNPGVATCTTSSLPSGTDLVTADYSGDTNHNPGSGSVSQVVNSTTTGTIVNSSQDPSAYGQSVSFTAAVTGNSPTGTVQFYIDSALFDTETLVSGTATSASISTLAVGTHTVTATYSGDTNNAGSNGTLAGGQVVGAAGSTTAVTSTPNPSTYAASVTFTATITADNGLLKGRNNLRGKPLDITGTVAWSANTGCSPSTVSGVYPGIATCTTSSATHLPVGSDTVTATYSGDSNHAGSMGTDVQVVTGGIATTIDVTSVSPSAEDFGANSPVTITAVLSWTGHGVAPTASDVTIGGNGFGTYGATTCAARVHETITCTATYTPTTADVAGVYTETASFSGDSNYGPSSSSETNNFTINGATSTTGVTSSLNPSTYGQAVTFTATVEGENGAVRGRKGNGRKPLQVSGGSVSWNISCDSSTPLNPSTGLATCTASSLAGGTDTVTATYNPDANHSGSSGSVSQTVNQASQTITCGALPASEPYNGSFTASCSASSSLTLSYGSSGSCSNVGPTYTMTSGAGSCLVTVTQAGNSNYLAAPPFNGGVTATPASQTITVSVPAPAAAYNKSVFTVVAAASSGLPITYAASGSCTVSGSTYTITKTTGTCTETMTQTGSTNYSAATPVIEQTTATKATAPTVTFTGAPTTALYGSTYTVTATSNETGSQVSVPVIATVSTACSVGPASNVGAGSYQATVTITKGAGSCSVTAKWAANYVYSAASKSQYTTAQKVTPTLSFTGAPATANKGDTFTVTASSDESGTYAVVPKITSTTGTVCSVGATTSNGSGGYQATVTMKAATGTCSTKAAWATSTDYAAASATQSTTAE
ncbi:MAG: Ig-like domain repeat protein [Terriglobales bacterium]